MKKAFRLFIGILFGLSVYALMFFVGLYFFHLYLRLALWVFGAV